MWSYVTDGKYAIEGLAVDQTNGTVWMAQRGAGNVKIPAMGANYFPVAAWRRRASGWA